MTVLYNVYNEKTTKKKVLEKEAPLKLKKGLLKLSDPLNFDDHREWYNLFGVRQFECHYELNDETYNHIYMITNLKSGLSYIGQTNDVIRRKSQHCSQLKTLKHENTEMQLDAFIYGMDSFIFEIVEFNVKTENLLKRERKWITYFDTEYPNGYNAPYQGREEYNNRSSVELLKSFILLMNQRNEENEDFKENLSGKVDRVNRIKYSPVIIDKMKKNRVDNV